MNWIKRLFGKEKENVEQPKTKELNIHTVSVSENDLCKRCKKRKKQYNRIYCWECDVHMAYN